MNTRVVNLECQLKPTSGGIEAEELTVAGTVVAAGALSARTSHCWVSVKSGSVYATFDGTDPETGGAVGVLLAAGYNGIWSARLVAAARFIQGSGAAKVRIEQMAE